jgi:hypothetical protein
MFTMLYNDILLPQTQSYLTIAPTAIYITNQKKWNPERKGRLNILKDYILGKTINKGQGVEFLFEGFFVFITPTQNRG